MVPSEGGAIYKEKPPTARGYGGLAIAIFIFGAGNKHHSRTLLRH